LYKMTSICDLTFGYVSQIRGVHRDGILVFTPILSHLHTDSDPSPQVPADFLSLNHNKVTIVAILKCPTYQFQLLISNAALYSN